MIKARYDYSPGSVATTATENVCKFLSTFDHHGVMSDLIVLITNHFLYPFTYLCIG